MLPGGRCILLDVALFSGLCVNYSMHALHNISLLQLKLNYLVILDDENDVLDGHVSDM